MSGFSATFPSLNQIGLCNVLYTQCSFKRLISRELAFYWTAVINVKIINKYAHVILLNIFSLPVVCTVVGIDAYVNMLSAILYFA